MIKDFIQFNWLIVDVVPILGHASILMKPTGPVALTKGFVDGPLASAYRGVAVLFNDHQCYSRSAFIIILIHNLPPCLSLQATPTWVSPIAWFWRLQWYECNGRSSVLGWCNSINGLLVWCNSRNSLHIVGAIVETVCTIIALAKTVCTACCAIQENVYTLVQF